jgi:hypothetical protein
MIPISDGIRKNAADLAGAAYRQIRTKTTNKEILYQAVISAMLDYNDRFGETVETFDEYHKEQIINSCDRIIEQMEISGNGSDQELPENPPPGFTREMMDALDNAVRYRNLYN